MNLKPTNRFNLWQTSEYLIKGRHDMAVKQLEEIKVALEEDEWYEIDIRLKLQAPDMRTAMLTLAGSLLAKASRHFTDIDAVFDEVVEAEIRGKKTRLDLVTGVMNVEAG